MIRQFELVAWSSLKYISLYFVAVKNVAFSIKRHLLCSFYQFLGQKEILNSHSIFSSSLFRLHTAQQQIWQVLV